MSREPAPARGGPPSPRLPRGRCCSACSWRAGREALAVAAGPSAPPQRFAGRRLRTILNPCARSADKGHTQVTAKRKSVGDA